jgi:hypothetical protein
MQLPFSLALRTGATAIARARAARTFQQIVMN